MLDRSRLRRLVAGSLVATGLLGGIAASHAQASFWQHLRAVGNSAHGPRVAGGMEVASVRAESRDHVRAQIERMEARARADDRLSGRPDPDRRDDGRGDGRAARNPDRASQADAQAGNDPRPTGMGPGWQARSRDGGR
ncbi:hypothetical protein [Cupriavidus plantarum]|uniref:hypothetical protein n=1 Tax=Cupriavidus plantarum TaxID=942865 RepID=UPI001B1E69B2|nr:hypothetical protein [Cupriavidus plantarum]CAG2143365.1 hypothetical protein LMG26296_03395 [Cupriavidus plantarum]SMR65688.1 hypothetical protein SAMN05421735_0539 [Cupriavidus plantarum]